MIAKVKVSTDRVHILTEECSMNVSQLISSLNLEGRWHMIFESVLTWDNNCTKADKQLRGLDRALVQTNGSSSGELYGMMHGRSRVDVWCELAEGFSFMPLDLLQNGCNLALDTLMHSLLPIFMKQLSEDYQKWATDKAYRDERATWNIDRFKQKSK